MADIVLRMPFLTITAIAYGLMMPTAPAHASRMPEARLVHCGEGTCLRLSGHRSQLTSAVRVAGQDLAVEGGHAWHVNVPLATARTWATASNYLLLLTLADPRRGIESTQAVLLPPGALGPRISLAAMVVRAH